MKMKTRKCQTRNLPITEPETRAALSLALPVSEWREEGEGWGAGGREGSKGAVKQRKDKFGDFGSFRIPYRPQKDFM